MSYTVKFRKGHAQYYNGSNVSVKSRGNFRTKTSARKAIIRTVRTGNPWARNVSQKKILSIFKIVKR